MPHGKESKHITYANAPIGTDGSWRDLIEKDSTQENLESMYLSIFFYLDISSLASLVCRDRLGCLGYKYVLSFIVGGLSHDQYNNTLQFPLYFFGDFAFSFLFFDEFFRVDQGRLTFERLDLLVSFSFTE